MSVKTGRFDRSADEMDQTGRSAEREFAILGLNRRSALIRNIQAGPLKTGPSAFALTVMRRLDGIV